MALKQPESVDECLYFTRRKFDPKGHAMAWAFRKECPKCKKGLMKKPKKTSPTYDCPACGYSEPKTEHEESATINIEYVCPSCGHAGETTTPYKRRTWQGVKAFVFTCQACNEKIGLTKKMKEPKKK
jgi:predicted RNA-binding Zn-ribbon protein involved in translation (DUF1610 family)